MTFTPSQAGTRTGTPSVSDNAAGGPQTVVLSGTGYAPPAVIFSATNLNFGGVAVGTQSGTQSVVLSNSGSSALTITNIAVTGTNAADFVSLTGTGK